MAAPTNISYATATVISTFPYDFTQTDINFAGVNYTVYYKFTAPIGSIVVGAWCFSGNISTGYRPTTFLYLAPNTAIPPYDPINAINKPFQFSVTPGLEYVLQVVKNIDDSVANQLRVRLEIAVNGSITVGNFLINDDAPGFPLAVLSHTTDYLVNRFVNNIAAGEVGDALSNGIIAFDDFNTRQIRLYDHDIATIGNVTYVSGNPMIRACRPLSKFYVAFDKNPVIVRIVNSDATYGPTTWTLTGKTSCYGFAPSNDGSKFYFVDRIGGSAIHVYDSVGLVFLADLVVGIGSSFVIDILVLLDDTILAIYEPITGVAVTVKHYSAAGATLNTYVIGTNDRPGGSYARLASSLNDLTSFWVWMHNANGISKIYEIKVSDGTILTTCTYLEYETGIMQATTIASPLSRYGPSFSCPLIIARVGGLVPTTPIPSGGIYFSNTTRDGTTGLPTLTHDRYYTTTNTGTPPTMTPFVKKIPNPTIKTGMIGE